MGVALALISCAGAYLFHPLPTFGFVLALVSLFFDGYRYIFVGYIVTLAIALGIILLVLITVCGSAGHM